MKTIKTKLLAVAVCLGLAASAAATWKEADDARTNATFDVPAGAIKAYPEGTSGGESSASASEPQHSSKLVWRTESRSGGYTCIQNGSYMYSSGKSWATETFCYRSQNKWYDYQEQYEEYYIDGNKTGEAYRANRCTYKGTVTQYHSSSDSRAPSSYPGHQYSASGYRQAGKCSYSGTAAPK